MKPSELAEKCAHVASHVAYLDGDQYHRLLDALIPAAEAALEAAEREAFEAGVTLGRLWEDGSLDSEYDIATKPTYDDWRNRED